MGSEFWSEAEDEACRTVLDKFVETGVGTGEGQHYCVEEKERGWGGADQAKSSEQTGRPQPYMSTIFMGRSRAEEEE